MIDATLTCPKCGSTDVEFNAKRGMYICWDCGQRFSLAPAEPAAPAQPERAKTPLNIFMSYGHTEEPIVRRIKERLEARGHTVWFDASEIKVGDEWRDKIAQGVASSNGVIACLSKHAFRDGGVCHDEIDIAIGVRGGNIKTILLDPEGEVRPPSAISHIQWLDMALWHEKLAAGPAVFDPWFEQCMAELIRVIESDESLQFQGEITRIAERLSVFTDNSRRAYLLARPFQGRAWLAEQVAAWVESRETPRVCLVTGDAGVGKSAFAAHLSHWGWKLYGRVAASFFCEAGRGVYNDPRIVIQTLAYLLACRIPQYRTLLAATLERKRDLAAMNADDLFALLIGDPLTHAIDGGHECMLIVVDGIDEAGDAEANPLAETLARYANRLPAWMKVLVTSRRVSAATAPFGTGVEHIDLSSTSANNMGDVRDFLAARLEHAHGDNPGFDAAVDTLAKASGGIFLYASLMADAILKNNVTLADAATTCPQGLSEMFYQWFRWTFPDLREYRETFRTALALIAAAPGGALPVAELPIIFGWDGNTQNDFLRRVEVFIRRVESNRDGASIAFAHAFIAQWLQSADAGAYQSLPHEALKLMGTRYAQLARDGYGNAMKALTDYEAANLLDVLEAANPEAYSELLGNTRIRSELGSRLNRLFQRARSAGKTAYAADMARGILRHLEQDEGASSFQRRSWMGRLTTCCMDLNRYSEAEKCRRDVLVLLQRELDSMAALKQKMDPKHVHSQEDGTRAKLRETLVDLGKLLSTMGRHGEAEQTLLDALDRYKVDKDDGFHVDPVKHANVLFALAQAVEAQGKLAQAESYYREVIEIENREAEHTKDASAQEARKRGAARAQTALAHLLSSQGRRSEAKGLFRQASTTGNAAMSLELNRGTELLIMRRLEQDDCVAGSSFAKVRQELRDFLFEQTYCNPHFIPKLPDDPEQVVVELDKRILEIKGRHSMRSWAANDCLWLAKCLFKQGRVEEADQRFREAIEMKNTCYRGGADEVGVTASPVGSYLKGLLDALDGYALFLHRTERAPEALGVYGYYLPDPTKLNPDTVPASSVYSKVDYSSGFYAFARSLLLYGGLLADEGIKEDAAEAYRWAFVMEQAAEDPDRRNDYSKAAAELAHIGERERNAGNLEKAEAAFADALALCEYIAQKKPAVFGKQLSGAHSVYADLLNNRLHRFDEAAQHYRAALGIRKKLAADNPEKYLPLVASSHISLGITLMNAGKLEEAVSEYDAAAGIYRGLFEKEPSTYRAKLEDALSHERISLIELGDEDAARAVFVEEVTLLNDMEGKASRVDINSLAFGTMAQLLVDMYLFEAKRYGAIDFEKRDQAILELDQKLYEAAADYLNGPQLKELEAMLEGDGFSEEALYAFFAKTGLADVLSMTWQRYLTEFAW